MFFSPSFIRKRRVCSVRKSFHLKKVQSNWHMKVEIKMLMSHLAGNHNLGKTKERLYITDLKTLAYMYRTLIIYTM